MTIERAKLLVSDEADRCRSLGQFQREKIVREALEAIVALERASESRKEAFKKGNDLGNVRDSKHRQSAQSYNRK
jgi:hypothetical protein